MVLFVHYLLKMNCITFLLLHQFHLKNHFCANLLLFLLFEISNTLVMASFLSCGYSLQHDLPAHHADTWSQLWSHPSCINIFELMTFLIGTNCLNLTHSNLTFMPTFPPIFSDFRPYFYFFTSAEISLSCGCFPCTLECTFCRVASHSCR